jgi:hypothetical protein
VTGGRSQPDRTVMILGAHITEIGESAKIIVPKDSKNTNAVEMLKKLAAE